MYDFIEPVLFAVLSIGIIGAGAAVVLLNRITAGALLMAFTFLAMAGMFVLLGAETIAAFQVLIYVGAITVLILYGVMFTPQSERPYALFFQTQTPWAAVFVALIATPVLLLSFAFRDARLPLERGADLKPMATSLFSDFAFPFEVASVLLLAAMIGAIVLVRRDENEGERGSGLSGPGAGAPVREARETASREQVASLPGVGAPASEARAPAPGAAGHALKQDEEERP